MLTLASCHHGIWETCCLEQRETEGGGGGCSVVWCVCLCNKELFCQQRDSSSPQPLFTTSDPGLLFSQRCVNTVPSRRSVNIRRVTFGQLEPRDVQPSHPPAAAAAATTTAAVPPAPAAAAATFPAAASASSSSSAASGASCCPSPPPDAAVSALTRDRGFRQGLPGWGVCLCVSVCDGLGGSPETIHDELSGSVGEWTFISVQHFRFLQIYSPFSPVWYCLYSFYIWNKIR